MYKKGAGRKVGIFMLAWLIFLNTVPTEWISCQRVVAATAHQETTTQSRTESQTESGTDATTQTVTNTTTQTVTNTTTQTVTNTTTQTVTNTTTQKNNSTTQCTTQLLPYAGEQAKIPQVIFKSAVSIWVNATADIEYGIRVLGAGTSYCWQEGNFFFGLSENTTYEIVARYKAKENYQAGGMSQPLVVTTDEWTYSLRYVLNGGHNNAGNILRFQKGQSQISLCSPYRAGYLFLGWYRDPGFQQPLTEFSCDAAQDQHIYAKWEKINQNKITGVKATARSGKRIQYTFTARENAAYYELQYATDNDFNSETTTKLKLYSTSYLTDSLAGGISYYARVRAITVDSAGKKVYTAYSAVKSKHIKASANATAASVAAGKKKSITKKKKSTVKIKAGKKGKKVKKKRKIRTYTKSRQYLFEKDQKQLAIPAKYSKKEKVIAKSANKKIATVNRSGLVTAKRAGKTKITLQAGGKKFVYPVVVEDVSLSQTSADLVVGDTLQLSLNGASKKATWKSSKKSVVSVNKTGKITVTGAGTAMVTASYREREYTCKISSITLEAKKISNVSNFYFSQINRTIGINEGAQTLQYEVTPATVEASQIAWYSSNTAVATVQDGVVTPVGIGSAFICVKYKNGTVKMKVNITDSSERINRIHLVSHRGDSSAPENSLKAFEKAADAGYHYLETDIRWTKDNVPVLIHDDTVGRTSDAVENVKVGDLTYEELMKLDFGSRFGEKYKGTKIVRLDAFLALCKQKGVNPYIEVKGDIYYERADLLANLVDIYGLRDRVTWISFSEESLASISELIPQARLGYLSSTLSAAANKTILRLRNGSNEVFSDISYKSQISKGNLRTAGNNGIDIEYYTVDDVAEVQRLIDCGAAGVTTNTVTPKDIQ